MADYAREGAAVEREIRLRAEFRAAQFRRAQTRAV